MSSYDDQIAAFLTKGGQVKRIETGAQTLTASQMKRAIGYQTDTETKYEAFLTGEDGGDFCINITATSKAKAIEALEMQYPEASINSIGYYGAGAERLYHEADQSEGY